MCAKIGWLAALGGFLLVGGNPAFINHAQSRPHTAFLLSFSLSLLHAKGVYTYNIYVSMCVCVYARLDVPPVEWNSGAPSVLRRDYFLVKKKCLKKKIKIKRGE